jgi:hypothetical protein
MVNNSTNINHHSLNTKKGGTPSDVGDACHGLGQDKWIGSEKDALQQGTPMTTKAIDACCEYDILHTQGT